MSFILGLGRVFKTAPIRDRSMYKINGPGLLDTPPVIIFFLPESLMLTFIAGSYPYNFHGLCSGYTMLCKASLKPLYKGIDFISFMNYIKINSNVF